VTNPPAVGPSERKGAAEKKRGSREKQLENSVLYLLPTAVASVIPLITLPVLARILTPEEFGTWALATVYGVFASGVANLGLTVGYERNFFQHSPPVERAALLYSVVGFVLFAATVTGVVTWVLRDQISQFVIGDMSHGLLVFWAFCANAVVGVKGYYLLYFKNTEDARRYVWYSIDDTVLAAVASLALVAWLKIGPIGLVIGQFVASTIVLAAVGRHVGRILKPAYDWPILRDALKISLPLTPRIFLGVVGNNFDKYLLGLLSTMGGVGVYTIGQRFAYVVFQYMTALGNVYTPEVYRRMFGQDETTRVSIGRYLTPFAYASTAVALVMGLFAEEALWLLMPNAYAGAVPVISLLSLSYALMFFGKIPQLTFARKTYLASVLAIVSIALGIGINVLTVPRWGALGAAAGTLTAGALTGLLSFVLGQRYFRIRWESGKMLATFGLLFASTFLIVVLRGRGAPYSLLAAAKLSAIAAYVVLGVRFKLVTVENAVMVRDLVFRRRQAAV
jgi:O-antigen/teichoic acid export membrane protein